MGLLVPRLMILNLETFFFFSCTETYSCQQKNIVLCIEVLSHDTRRKRDVLDNHQNQNYEEGETEDGERFAKIIK